MPEPDANLLDAEKVSAMLSVARSTVYGWARQGVLPCTQLGRLVRFDRADVLAFIRERRRLKEGE